MNDYLDISYLAEGNPRQKHCYRILTEGGIMDALAPWKPLVAGTIPIGIDTPSSDVDIVCEAGDIAEFGRRVCEMFGACSNFNVRYHDRKAMVCSFTVDGLDIEIYATPHPPVESPAYRHMMVEKRLLDLLGTSFRHRVVDLKMRGMKTEPVFAWLLGLAGNPYDAILGLEVYSDRQLAELFLR